MAYQRLDITDLKTILTAAQISHIEDGIIQNESDIADNTKIIGSKSISTIADGTLTGAVAELNTDISQINSDLANLNTYTRTTGVLESGFTSSNGVNIYKVGRLGIISAQIQSSQTSISGTVATIPEGFRPVFNQFLAVAYSSPVNGNCYARILTSGEINLYFSTSSSSLNALICGAFVVAE